MHTKSERYIQIVTVESGSSRPKLVPTSVKTEDHTIRQMNVALQIQHLELWRQDAEDNVTVYFIGFPEFISASDLIDFKLLYTALRRWDVHVSGTAGCIDLTWGPTCCANDRCSRRRLPDANGYGRVEASWLEACASVDGSTNPI